jgi:NIPSNAP protein
MILEIRTYRLRPGTTESFVAAMAQAVVLLAEFGIDVVAYGASLVREDGHEEAYLIRSFESVEAHEAQEDRFYSSAQWRDGPRAAVVSCIESYHSVVLDTSALSGLSKP